MNRRGFLEGCAAVATAGCFPSPMMAGGRAWGGWNYYSVIDVPPGGETFTLTLLSAQDEEMRIVDKRAFRSNT
jgi:hypothetical protein